MIDAVDAVDVVEFILWGTITLASRVTEQVRNVRGGDLWLADPVTRKYVEIFVAGEAVKMQKPRYSVEKGQVFGYWKVVSGMRYVPGKGSSVTVRCYCGNFSLVSVRDLVRERTKSCGCAAIAKSHRALRQLKYIWLTDVKSNHNKAGGWLTWIDFKRWALKSGFMVDARLCRFNVNEPYAPMNCFWEVHRQIRGSKYL